MVSTKPLIQKGYFPKELIPPFTTDKLAKSLPSILPDLDDFLKNQSWSIPYTFTFYKKPNKRRHFSIPNPLHFIKLCKVIEDNWGDINNFISQSDLSLSTPVVRKSSKWALERQYNYGEFIIERTKRSVGYHYVLTTDIAEYYHRIYTHSIAWALHGKKVAKSKIGNYSLFGNEIDRRVRNAQDGQSIGIPIGPDTSLLLSEIIGVCIDNLLSKKVKNIVGCRYIDDYYLYFNNMHEAERILSIVQQLLKEFELEINEEKTNIMNLPQPLEREWVAELSGFELKYLPKEREENDLKRFFNLIYKYSIEFPEDSIVKYALQKLKQYKVTLDNWDLFESLLLKTLLIHNNAFEHILQIFISYNKIYKINKAQIEKTLISIIKVNNQLGNYYEIVWALWFAKSLDIKLKGEIVKEISKIEDSLVALVALDMHNNDDNLKELNLSFWTSLMRKEELYSSNWILAYEGLVKGWLKSKNGVDYIANDDFFSLLRSKKIEFYNPKNQIEPIQLKDFRKEKAPDEEEEGLEDLEWY